MYRLMALLTLGIALACGGSKTSTTSADQSGTESSTNSSDSVSESGSHTESGTEETTSEASSDESSSSSETDSESSETDTTQSSESGPDCTPPDPLTFSFEIEQVAALAALTGESEIIAGVSLPQRASATNRGIARDYLLAQLIAMGYDAQIHMYSSDGGNVYAILDGNDASDEYVLFGAHFDSVQAGPGAGDNATGTVMVLAAAKFAMQLPCRSRNVAFVLFDQEEIGLVGSEAFVEWIGDEGWTLHSAHTIDMVSWDEDGDRALEVHRPDGDLFAVYEEAVDALGTGIELTSLPVRSSDHTSFRDAGYDAVGLMEEWQTGDTTPHYHTASDTYDKINLPYLASSTQVVLQVVTQLVATP